MLVTVSYALVKMISTQSLASLKNVASSSQLYMALCHQVCRGSYHLFSSVHSLAFDYTAGEFLMIAVTEMPFDL